MASLEDLGFQSLCKGSRDSTGAVSSSSREPWIVLLGSVLTLGLGMAYSLIAERHRLRDELAKMLPADRGPVLDGLSHLSNQGHGASAALIWKGHRKTGIALAVAPSVVSGAAMGLFGGPLGFALGLFMPVLGVARAPSLVMKTPNPLGFPKSAPAAAPSALK